MYHQKKALRVIALLVLSTLLVGATPGQPAAFASIQYGLDLSPVPAPIPGDPFVPIALSLDQVTNIGFTYAQYYVSWKDVEPQKDVIKWDWLDPIVTQAWLHNNVQLVFRIYQTPVWAKTLPGAPTPADSVELGRFLLALADRYQSFVAGYVIWNEPNTAAGWEGHTVSAAAYAGMLCEAYKGVKAGYAGAKVVSAGLAPTMTADRNVSDLDFLAGMYAPALGFKTCADVVGMNGFGFEHQPDDTTDVNHMNFNRLADLHRKMVLNQDNRPAWALEVGWVANTLNPLPGFDAYKVSETMQARYLRRAMEKAKSQWPWLEVMFIWNLDFGADGREPEKAFFAILKRPAYNCVRLNGVPQCPPGPPRAWLPLLMR